jgi:hypothetical protein
VDNRERVYGDWSKGANANAIRDVIEQLDTPITTVYEPVFPGYAQVESVARQKPSLAIVHLSSFYPWRRDSVDRIDLQSLERADEELRAFVDYLVRNTPAHIIVYTTGLPPNLATYDEPDRNAIERGYATQKSFIEANKGRVELLEIPRGRNFGDALVANQLRDKVREAIRGTRHI